MPLDLNGVTLNGASGFAFNPVSLFAAGTQGAFYDPSDLNTLFQDAAGTTPVTAAGQQVGLMLDKSKGLTLGSELMPATDASDWTASASNTVTDDVDGSVLVTYVDNQFGATLSLSALIPAMLDISKTFKITYEAKVNTGSALVRVLNFVGNTTNGPVISSTNYVSHTFIGSWDGSGGISLNFNNLGAGEAINIRNISVRELPGNHATQSTSLNRPTLQTAAGLWYLDFDGSNDAMATASINFTATDEMSVFAGLTKNSNASTRMLVELSAAAASNNGAFDITAPNTNGYGFELRGTASTTYITATQNAPHTAVLSANYDIGQSLKQDEIISRLNGVVDQTTSVGSANAGTGNFGNYPLYIGARAGTSLFFNGRLYSLIVLGRTATAGEITSTEQWVAGKTGVTI